MLAKRNKFSLEEEDKLIRAVSQRPALFDKQNKYFYNKIFRAQMWKEIGGSIGRDGPNKSPVCDVSSDDPSSPDGTNNEYIPPPMGSPSSSDSNCVQALAVYEKRSKQDIDRNHENNIETLKLEFDNDSKQNCLFDEEKINNVKQKCISKLGNKNAKMNEDNDYTPPHIAVKKTLCKFCESEIISRHFARHLERNHSDERQVKKIMSLKLGSNERRKYLMLIRNEGNLDSAIRGKIVPKKCKLGEETSEKEYAICMHCKGYYRKLCLSRHVKICFARNNSKDISHKRPLAESLVFAACQKKHGEILSKLDVKNKIFSRMQGDDITKAAIGDILIAYYGEDLLKKNKMKHSCSISNKLRECGRFIIEMKKLDSFDDMLSMLQPENFDKALYAVKSISKYDAASRTFGAASLALHFRNTLSTLCDLASKLILRKKIPYVGNIEEILKNLGTFKYLVDSQWSVEIGSLALKDLNAKSSTKPKLLPLTEDIIKLVKLVGETAEDAYKKVCLSKDIDSYKVLSETTLVLTILHNRTRVGDVQYLEWKSCEAQLKTETVNQHTELVASLTDTEKVLTQSYKKITSIGKESKTVTILLPKNIQKYVLMLCRLRREIWFPPDNIYLFTNPYSMHWIDGCSAVRKYASRCNARHADLFTSSRLRKHIATVTQLFSLRDNEVDQLAKFMGHTIKIHETFYKLPQDVNQIAKISKALQILEKGNAEQFENKSLDEIDINIEIIDELEEEENDITDTISVEECKNRFKYLRDFNRKRNKILEGVGKAGIWKHMDSMKFLDKPSLLEVRFPTDVVKRKKWCDLLGIYLPSYDVPKRAKACSDHFDDNDFRYCKDRRKLLNRNAYPKPWKSIDNSIRLHDPKHQPCTSKDVIFEYGTDDSMSGIENLPIDDCVSETILSNVLDVESVSKTRPIAAEATIEEDETSSSSSSTTLTASSTERQLLSLLKNNPDSLPENAVGPLSAFRGSLRLIEKRKNR